MNFLTRLKLRNKLILLMGFSALALVVSNGLAASILRDRMLADRIDKLRTAVDMTDSFANALEPQVASGQLTRDQATARLREAIHAMRFDAGDGYISMQRLDDGVLVAHGTDPSREGKVSSAADTSGKQIVDLVRDALRDGSGTISYMFPKPGQTEPLRKVAYVEVFAPLNATMLAGAYTDDLDNAFHATVWRLVSIAGGILLFTLLAAWMINRDIAGSLQRLKSAMESLASGELGTEIPGTSRRDEVGEMAATVLVFKQNMVHARELDECQRHAREETETGRRAAMVEMAEKIEHEAKDALGEIARRTAAMAENARNMTGSAGRTGTSAQSAATAASQAMTNVQTVASAAEQLAASIHEIGGQVSQSTAVVARAVEAGRETRQKIETLNQQVGQIGAVADMIGEIAAKTNLLALNATIEAARAGEAGKGFAVVASEVKQLAMQSARSTQEIARHIGEVRTATRESAASVGRIEATIDEVNAIAGSIAAAVEQQGAATAEIARNVSETAAAADAMTQRSSEVATEAQRTGGQANEVLENITGLEGAVHELQRSMIRVVRTATRDVDRREARRRPCLAEAAISGGGQSVSGTVQDISETGCFVTAASQFGDGQELALELTRFGRRLRGKVVAQSKDGVHVEFVGDGLKAADADRISLATIADAVKLTKNDHVAFVKRVVDAVTARDALPPSSLASQHDCRLGRWYDNVSDPATLALRSFRALAEPHHAVHDTGRAALTALAEGDLAGAERSAAALRRHSEQVLSCLDAFDREFPGTITEQDTARAAA